MINWIKKLLGFQVEKIVLPNIRYFYYHNEYGLSFFEESLYDYKNHKGKIVVDYTTKVISLYNKGNVNIENILFYDSNILFNKYKADFENRLIKMNGKFSWSNC